MNWRKCYNAGTGPRDTYSASNPSHIDVQAVSGGGFPSYDKHFTKPAGKLIRIWKKNNDGTIRSRVDVISGGDYVPDAIEIPWTALSNGDVAHLWVEAVDPSGSLGDITINASIKEGTVEVDDNIRMTSLKITCEPITAERQNGLYPYNPAGIVKGESAKYRIDVEPSDYPGAEITWVANGRGSCGNTSSNGTIREAVFTASSAGGGYVIPLVKGNYYTDPIFPIQVFDAWSDVTMNVFIAQDAPVPPATIGTPALSPSSLASVVNPMNEIFKQAGIRFNPVIKPWALAAGNGEAYFNIPDEASARAALANCPTSGGVRVLFVNSLPGNILGWHFPGRGILCGASGGTGGVSELVGHELGHACNLRDIYVSETLTSGVSLALDLRYKARRDWSVRDWPEDGSHNCQPAYYSRFASRMPSTATSPDGYATRQVDLIPRLLMFGKDGPDTVDLPMGKVHGVRKIRIGFPAVENLIDDQTDVGLADMNRFPSHD